MTDDFDESQVAGPESEQPPEDSAGGPAEGDAEGTTGDERPPTGVDVRSLHRAYTQGQQDLGVVRRELGLPRTATSADIATAITKLRSSAVVAGATEGGELPPEVRDQIKRVEDREWQAARRIHGEAIAGAARALVDQVRGGQLLDINDIVDEFAAAVVKAGGSGQAPAGGGTAPQGQPSAGSSFGVGAGREAPLTRQTPSLEGLPRTEQGRAEGFRRLREAFIRR